MNSWISGWITQAVRWAISNKPAGKFYLPRLAIQTNIPVPWAVNTAQGTVPG